MWVCFFSPFFNCINKLKVSSHSNVAYLADLGILNQINEIHNQYMASIHIIENKHTSSGTVAENKSVCRCLGTAVTIFSISFRKPISKRRSASSRMRTLTPISWVANPGVFSIWSRSLPGVATRICKCNIWVLTRITSIVERTLTFPQEFQYFTWHGLVCIFFCSSANRVPPITTCTQIDGWNLRSLSASAAAWSASSRVGQITRTLIGGLLWSRSTGGNFETTSIAGSWSSQLVHNYHMAKLWGKCCVKNEKCRIPKVDYSPKMQQFSQFQFLLLQEHLYLQIKPKCCHCPVIIMKWSGYNSIPKLLLIWMGATY